MMHSQKPKRNTNNREGYQPNDNEVMLPNGVIIQKYTPGNLVFYSIVCGILYPILALAARVNISDIMTAMNSRSIRYVIVYSVTVIGLIGLGCALSAIRYRFLKRDLVSGMGAAVCVVSAVVIMTVMILKGDVLFWLDQI